MTDPTTGDAAVSPALSSGAEGYRLRKLHYLMTAVFLPMFIVHGLAFPFYFQAVFLKMFSDFGTEIPWLTRLVLNRNLVIIVSVIPATIFGLSMSKKIDDGGRTFLIGISIVTSLTIIIVYLVGFYLPIFELSASIQAD